MINYIQTNSMKNYFFFPNKHVRFQVTILHLIIDLLMLFLNLDTNTLIIILNNC